jgi:predicted O-methyltransferase YrrM
MTATLNVLPIVLREAMETGKVETADGRIVNLNSNVSIEEALSLYEVVRDLKPKRSAEVGFACGVSALSILQALKDNGVGEHNVIDPYESFYGDVGLTMVKKARVENHFRFHRSFAEEIIPALPRLQFAFVDASHLFDLSLVEFVLLDKKLEVGGIIGFHDMWMPSLQRLMRYILTNRSYEVVREFDGARDNGGNGSLIKRTLRSLLNALPRKERLFKPDALIPWKEMDIRNLALLRKTADDNREWKFHKEF